VQRRVSPEGKPTSYCVRYNSESGRKQRLGIGSVKVFTPTQARDLARAAIVESRKGEDPQAIKRKLRGGFTIGSFIEKEYGPKELIHKRSGKATQARLKSCFAALWKRPLTDPTLHDALLAWRATRTKHGTTNLTINRDLGALRAVFSYAVRSKVIQENPATGIKQLPVDSSPKVRYLKPAERKRLMAALDKREEKIRNSRDKWNTMRERLGYELYPDLKEGRFVDHLKPMVLLALNTGIRRGEMFGLDWEDVDFKRAVLTIRGEIAKNGKTRHVPLNSVALGVLKEWRKQTSRMGLIFKSPVTGGRFDNVTDAWKKLLKAARIKKFRWHDMRHDFASQLLMAGEDLNTVRELLGHWDIKMTLRYAHLAPEKKAAAVERLVNGK
jgi:integrase